MHQLLLAPISAALTRAPWEAVMPAAEGAPLQGRWGPAEDRPRVAGEHAGATAGKPDRLKCHKDFREMGHFYFYSLSP